MKPYITPTRIVNAARQAGHVISPGGDHLTIDTGEDVLTMSDAGITDRSGKAVSIDAAMDIVTSPFEE